MDNATKKFAELLKIMHQLRKECPWDNEQTPESLRQYILEETYEVLETIDTRDWGALSKELGDLLLQIVFQSIIAEEEQRFNLTDVISHINNKMIERHPHVFSDKVVNSSNEVAVNWEHIKSRSEKRESLLSGIPKETPALLRAQRLQQKAANVGFDWDKSEDIMIKIEEEVGELKSAIQNQDQANIAEEMGDLLFSVVNLARFLDVVAEDSLRLTNEKFMTRFKKIEAHYNRDYKKMEAASLEELDSIWNKAKES